MHGVNIGRLEHLRFEFEHVSGSVMQRAANNPDRDPARFVTYQGDLTVYHDGAFQVNRSAGVNEETGKEADFCTLFLNTGRKQDRLVMIASYIPGEKVRFRDAVSGPARLDSMFNMYWAEAGGKKDHPLRLKPHTLLRVKGPALGDIEPEKP